MESLDGSARPGSAAAQAESRVLFVVRRSFLSNSHRESCRNKTVYRARSSRSRERDRLRVRKVAPRVEASHPNRSEQNCDRSRLPHH